VKETEHDAEAPVPLSEQLVALKVPVLSLLQLFTVPDGVLVVPPDVSVTVAVHVVGCPTVTGLGEQDMEVGAARLLTISDCGSLLPLWLASPPYVAVIVCVAAEVGVYAA
jgi:hypothetical protein